MYCPNYRPYGGGARSCHFGAAGVHRHALAGSGRAASGQAHARSFLKGRYLSHDISCTSLDESPGYSISRLISHESQVIYQIPTIAWGCLFLNWEPESCPGWKLTNHEASIPNCKSISIENAMGQDMCTHQANHTTCKYFKVYGGGRSVAPSLRDGRKGRAAVIDWSSAFRPNRRSIIGTMVSGKGVSTKVFSGRQLIYWNELALYFSGSL
jgi:hypothetical protein